MGDVAQLATFGIDVDRAQEVRTLEVVRRRVAGRYSVDPFGSDPQLQDLLSPLITRTIPARADGAENIPNVGPALFVSTRGFGVLEPGAVTVAVRAETGRRLRVVGAPEWPIVGDLLRKLGSIGVYPADLAAVLRAGHLAVLPLAQHWTRTGGGVPPTKMLVAALGYPVIPVAVHPGGPFGLPLTPWKVRFGAPITVGEIGDRDPLTAAELAEAVRVAVGELA